MTNRPVIMHDLPRSGLNDDVIGGAITIEPRSRVLICHRGSELRRWKAWSQIDAIGKVKHAGLMQLNTT